MKTPQEIFTDIVTTIPGCNCSKFLYRLTEIVNSKVVVDIGPKFRQSTFLFAINSNEVYSIDDASGISDSTKTELQIMQRKIDEYEFTNIIEIDKPIEEIHANWSTPIDILNIDIKDPTTLRQIFNNWSKFMSDTGVILFYDTVPEGDIRSFMHEIKDHKINLLFCDGLLVCSKNLDSIRAVEKEFESIQPSRIDRTRINKNIESKICMISMFKNEAHSIGNMLKSVTPFIDFWVMQDNGSTDGTPDIVKEWAEYSGIPGLLYQVEEGWVGFGWNRDHLLQKTKSIDHGCQWIMKMDCDETLEVDVGFDWKIFDKLDNQSFSVPAVAPGLIYLRTWIWRADLPWRFHHDPAHETIYVDDGYTKEGYQMDLLPTSFRMRAGEVKGESYATPTKYVTDSLILEEKLIRENSMLNDLYHFWYIAKSYEDAMRCLTFPLGDAHRNHYAERSIFYYKQWLNFTHQFEERGEIADRIDEMAYYSVCSIGNSYRFLGNIQKAIHYLEKAEAFCPRRNDHLIFLAESHWGLRDYTTMLHYTNLLMHPERKMPYPDFVFIISTDMYHDTGTYPQRLHAIALENQNTKPEESRFRVNLIKKKRLFVVDDFYKDVDGVRQIALNSNFAADNNWYKGQRSTDCFRTTEIKQSFEDIMGIKIKNWESHGMNGRFQSCTPEDLLVYHYDAQTWAGMVYLTPDAPYDCGTSFFASKLTGARNLESDPESKSFDGGFYDATKFELVDTVGNVYNRLVLFDARSFHSASKYFGSNIKDSRLFHMFFFD